MKQRSVFLFFLLFTAIMVAAQNGPTPRTYYTESYQRGPTQIKEDKTEIKVTSQDPVYKQRLRDSTGVERYELALLPKIGEAEGNDNITSWQVSLRDLRHAIYGNMLQFDQELSERPRDNMFWLNPVHWAPVPIRAKRIIKVDSFYLVFQVKDFRFTPADSPYLEYMTVDMSYTNTDPRTAAQ